MQSAKTRSEREAVNEPLIYKSERFSWNSLQINERADESLCSAHFSLLRGSF